MKVIVIALIVSLCSACSIYRLGTRQGNEITEEKLREAQSALTRDQIREILGTPLVQDPFQKSRWDYVFYYNKKGEPQDLRTLTVFFKEDLVTHIDFSGIPDNPKATIGNENEQFDSDGPRPAKEAPPSAVGSDVPQ